MAKIERPFGPTDDTPPPGSADDYAGLNGADGPEQANGKANGHAAGGKGDVEPLKMTRPTDLADIEPAPRRWLVEDWIIRGHLTTLWGAPKVGKSLIMQQLGIACATGTPWLGLNVTKGKVLGWFCEDDENELHRRAIDICRAQNVSMRDLCDIEWQGRAGEANVISAIGARDIMEPTDLFHRMERTIAIFRPDLLLLDNIGQMFAGNENARAHVTQFAALLIGWCVKYDLSGLLAGHPAKVEGSQYSGNTAWDATGRGRLFFERKKQTEDGPDTRDMRTLTCPSANYSAIGGELDLRWERGAFVPTDENPQATGGMVDSLQKNNDDQVVLAEIAERWNHPDAEPLSKAANMKDRYLPRFMSRKHGWKGKRAEAALICLTDAIKVTAGETRKRGKEMSGLRPVSHEK